MERVTTAHPRLKDVIACELSFRMQPDTIKNRDRLIREVINNPKSRNSANHNIRIIWEMILCGEGL